MHLDVQRTVLDLVGRAMGRFSMLRPGDRVAVGVSGGKDSLCLLDALLAYRTRAPFAYDVVAVTIEQGKFKSDIRALEPAIRDMGVRWVVSDEPATLALVKDGVPHGCDVCSRHRRRALYRLAAELECTTLALGHTADDCAESLLRNILFNGRIASLPPVAVSRKGMLRLVRPLVFVTEDLTAAYTRARGLATVGCACSDKPSVRGEIRAFLRTLRAAPGRGRLRHRRARQREPLYPLRRYPREVGRRAGRGAPRLRRGVTSVGGCGGPSGAPHVRLSRWAVLVLVTLAHALGALAVLSVAPLSPFLLDALHLSRAQVGLLLPAVYLGGVLMSLPAGWLTDRLGVRVTLGVGQAVF